MFALTGTAHNGVEILAIWHHFELFMAISSLRMHTNGYLRVLVKTLTLPFDVAPQISLKELYFCLLD